MNIELTFSCGLIDNQSLLGGVLRELIASGKQFLLKESGCGCDHGFSYQKLRMICTGNKIN